MPEKLGIGHWELGIGNWAARKERQRYIYRTYANCVDANLNVGAIRESPLPDTSPPHPSSFVSAYSQKILIPTLRIYKTTIVAIAGSKGKEAIPTI